MSDEKWLRDGLANAVPEPPTNPDRARAAESRARRRRRTTALAVLGSAGAVAAAAVLAVVLSPGGDGQDAVDTTSEGPAFVVECPPIKVFDDGTAQESEIDQPDPGAPDSVPEGATSARLCQGPGTVFEFPPDVLVTDVDDLVAAVNDLEVTGEPAACTMELGPGYRMAFGYDDGSTFVISGRLYGCQTLVVGSGYRARPEAAQAAFLDLLEAQGSDSEPSDEADAPDLTCSDTASTAGPDLADLTTAILCVDDGSGAKASATIAANDLELLLDDMATNQSNSVLRCALPPPHPTIVAADASGNRVLVPSECGAGFWRLPNGKAWMPGDEAVAILDRLVSEAG
jgi:hypothetical protein